jgi:hypothetical protein
VPGEAPDNSTSLSLDEPILSIGGPQQPGLASKDGLRLKRPPKRPGSTPIFPYLSSVYRDFVGCYLKSYQQDSNIHKPYVRTIEASSTRTMHGSGASRTG